MPRPASMAPRGGRCTCRSGLSGGTSPAALQRSRLRRYERVALAPQDDPVRALLLIEVQTLAVVAADAFALHDLRAADRAPLAGFLADLAGLALAPALDAEHGQRRQDAERRADRAEEPAVEI